MFLVNKCSWIFMLLVYKYSWQILNSWIFSDTAEAVCDTTPPPLLINLPTNPRCRNLQIPNLEILTMEMHKCSLWKIFTKADSRKLAQKLSFPASLVSFSFLQQSNAKIGLNFHEAL